MDDARGHESPIIASNYAGVKRRKLMEAWAAYCERATGNVVQIGKRKTP